MRFGEFHNRRIYMYIYMCVGASLAPGVVACYNILLIMKRLHGSGAQMVGNFFLDCFLEGGLLFSELIS